MPVIEAQTRGDDEGQAAAWRAAEADRAGGKGEMVVTGGALASADQELARNFELANPRPIVGDPRRMFRAPPSAAAAEEPAEQPGSQLSREERPLHPSDMQDLYVPPQERPAEAPRRPGRREPSVVDQGPAPVAAEPAVAPSVLPEDAEGMLLEQRLLSGTPSSIVDELPDQDVEIGGKKIRLSRIREGLQAANERERWQGELQKKQEVMTQAYRTVMQEEGQKFLSDPVGRLRQLGMNDDEIRRRVQAGGLPLADEIVSPPVSTPKLPEDADPLARALFEENRALKRAIPALERNLTGLQESIQREREQRGQQANEASRLATLSGVKSGLKSSVGHMPSMKDGDGRLSKLGDVLVDTSMLLLEREIGPRVPDHAWARDRAVEIFLDQAKSRGITPKAEQARKAIEGRRTSVPTRPGTTLASGPGAAPNAPDLKSFDWSNDDERRRAARAWFMRAEAEIPTG